MKVIGLTGGSGSGKTTAAACMQALGAKVIDCDAVYHGLLETDKELLREIDRAFPGVVSNGTLDRKKLGGVVFQDGQALLRLNAITHPRVTQAVQAKIRQYRDAELVLIEAFGLFDAGLSDLCDCTVAVCAPRAERIARLVLREGVSEQYAAMRIDAQISDEEYQSRCTYILNNDCDRTEFTRRCAALYTQLQTERSFLP